MSPLRTLGAFALATLAHAAVHYDSPLTKRHLEGDCSPQPPGVSGYPYSPDTDTAFLANPLFANAANNAATPSGYSAVFKNMQAILNAPGYLGYDPLQTYSPGYCAQRCGSSAYPTCTGFDIYFERDATVDPGVNCTNPPSLTYVRCAYYSSCFTNNEVTNTGQYCASFHIVDAGSNGYTLNSKCPSTGQSSTTTASPTTTSAKSSPTQPTCAACSSGPVTDNNGKQYTVSCNTAFNGDDLTPVAASCYDECFDICDRTPGCNAFVFNPSYNGGPHCYPKSIPAGSTEKSFPQGGTVFGQTSPSSCPACTGGAVNDNNGKQYTVSCDTNFDGEDLGPVPASCYEDCFDICDQNSQCNAFSWDPTFNGSPHCWPKNIPASSTEKPISQQGVIFGQMAPPAPSCPACTGGAVNDNNGKQYTVSCDTNFEGEDLGPVPASCYEDCFDICDQNSQCNAFSWDPTFNGSPHCWPKNIPASSTEKPISQPGVIYGLLSQGGGGSGGSSPPPTCNQPANGAFSCLGDLWSISCGCDFWGSDCTQVPVTCYDDCFNECQNYDGCTAFTFDADSCLCWLKNPAISSLSDLLPTYSASSCTFAQKVIPSDSQWSWPFLPGWSSSSWPW